MINFYWSPEPLQFGDQVDFRIATRSYDQLVYATDLLVFEKAKDIRFKVSICNNVMCVKMHVMVHTYTCMLRTICSPTLYVLTFEPPNRGHFENWPFVLCLEVVQRFAAF